jgi:type IV pilus assembly protein PilO
MTKLGRMRQTFTAVLAVLLLLDIALAAYLLRPGESNKLRRAEEQRLQQELVDKRRQAAPLHGMDQKLVDVRASIKKFYADSVVNHWSVISAELYKLAQENGVGLESIRYQPDDAGLPGLQRVKIETGIKGDYSKIAHFVNAVERSKMLFVINEISLSAQQGGTVELRIKFETFLKEAA